MDTFRIEFAEDGIENHVNLNQGDPLIVWSHRIQALMERNVFTIWLDVITLTLLLNWMFLATPDNLAARSLQELTQMLDLAVILELRHDSPIMTAEIRRRCQGTRLTEILRGAQTFFSRFIAPKVKTD